MLGEVLDEIFIIGHTGCNAGRGIESLGEVFMSPIRLRHATASTAFGRRTGLDSPCLYDGLSLFRRNVQRTGLPIMFALVALGKRVGSTTNEYRLCEVGRASMTAGYDLDGMLARSEDVLGHRGRTTGAESSYPSASISLRPSGMTCDEEPSGIRR